MPRSKLPFFFENRLHNLLALMLNRHRKHTTFGHHDLEAFVDGYFEMVFVSKHPFFNRYWPSWEGYSSGAKAYDLRSLTNWCAASVDVVGSLHILPSSFFQMPCPLLPLSKSSPPPTPFPVPQLPPQARKCASCMYATEDKSTSSDADTNRGLIRSRYHSITQAQRSAQANLARSSRELKSRRVGN